MLIERWLCKISSYSNNYSTFISLTQKQRSNKTQLINFNQSGQNDMSNGKRYFQNGKWYGQSGKRYVQSGQNDMSNVENDMVNVENEVAITVIIISN